MRTFVVCLFVAVVAYGVYRWWPGKSAPPPVAPVAGESAATAPGQIADVALPAPRKELFSAPRASIQPGQKMKVSPGCAKLWEDLRALDMSQKDRRVPSAAECGGTLPARLSKWHTTYVEACKNPSSTECEIATYDYRAALTEELTQDTPLNQIQDPKVLTDKMLARLRTPELNPASVADVAERLLETQPDLAQAARASVTMRIQAAENAVGKPDDPAWKKVDEALERAGRTMDGGSKSLLDAKLISDHLRYPDPERAEQEAESISRQYPRSGVGPFHEAWARFDKGDRQGAEEALREAVRRDPSYQEAYNEFKSGSPHPFHPPLPSFQFSP